MVLKCWRKYLKAAREAFVALFKKKRSEASSFPILDQCKINDNKLSTTTISNTEDDFRTCFCNKSANKSDLDSKEEGNHGDNENDRDNGDNRDDENLGEEHSKIEEETSSKVLKQKLK